MPYKGKELSMLIFLPKEMKDDTTGLEKVVITKHTHTHTHMHTDTCNCWCCVHHSWRSCWPMRNLWSGLIQTGWIELRSKWSCRDSRWRRRVTWKMSWKAWAWWMLSITKRATSLVRHVILFCFYSCTVWFCMKDLYFQWGTFTVLCWYFFHHWPKASLGIGCNSPSMSLAFPVFSFLVREVFWSHSCQVSEPAVLADTDNFLHCSAGGSCKGKQKPNYSSLEHVHSFYDFGNELWVTYSRQGPSLDSMWNTSCLVSHPLVGCASDLNRLSTIDACGIN